jgi:hypothetical protein
MTTLQKIYWNQTQKCIEVVKSKQGAGLDSTISKADEESD